MPAFSPGPTRDLRPARANRISRGTGGEVGVSVSLGIVPEGGRPCGSDFVAEAVALRDELRGLLGRVQSLIAGAKAERRMNAAVRTTLASLRQLQRLDS